MSLAIEFLFDYASPWVYLASEILERRFSGAEIRYQPVYLRGLETFARGLPYTPAKAVYLVKDFLRCTAHEGVPVTFPAAFPLNGIYALRGALVARERGELPLYHRTILRAAWRDDRDISLKEVVLAATTEAGLDGEAFAAGIESPAIKEQLKRETAAAQERGVFGVPGFFVGEELFWGHDRLDYVRRAAGL